MTKRQPPNPDGLNNYGTGRGMKIVTNPQPKKRGTDATPEAKAKRIANNRVNAMDTSSYANAELINPDKPLTEKQKLFVKHWAQGETIPTASARAGYGDGATFAYRMVRMPNVLRLYEQEKLAYEEASQMSRKKVMDGFAEAIDMAKLMADPTAMISGWREVAKMCGYYEPVQKKIDITLNGRVMVDKLERLSDAELFKLITEVGQEVLDHESQDDAGDDS